ncbi:hypothetical protein D3C80_1072610 [compost metagenome]
MRAVGIVPSELELLRDQAYLLAAPGVGDQQGVRGIDNDQAIQANAGNQALARIDVAVAHVMQHCFAGALVTPAIGRVKIAHGLPAADIAPAQLARDYRHLCRAFHDGVVDRNVRYPCKAVAVQFKLLIVFARAAMAMGEALADGAQYIAGVDIELFQQRACAQAEHPGIPKVLAAIEPGLSSVGIGFLDEPGDLETVTFQCRALFDVAESRFRAVRFEPERDEPALVGQVASAGDGVGKGIQVLDQVIGWQNQQLSVLAMLLRHMQCGGGDGGGSVAAERFEDEIQGCAGVVQRAVVVQGAKEHLAVDHRHNRPDTFERAGTGKGFLQQAFAVGQVQKGLGHRFARGGPQPGTGAAGDNAGNEHTHKCAA